MAKEHNKLERKNKNKWLWLCLAAVVIGAVVAWRLLWFGKDSKEMTHVQRGVVTEELVLTGQIKAKEHARLAFQSGGEIVWIGVDEGDEVKKGQMLARLDTVVLNAAYQQALANLRAAEATLARVYDEVKDRDESEDFITREKRTAAEVAKDKAHEGVVMAARNLRNAGITAPFAGVVTAVTHPRPGINTMMAESQIELVNPKSLYLEMSADQTEVVNLRLGMEVRVLMDAYLDEEFIGKIRHISLAPKQGEIGTVYAVKVEFDDADRDGLRVGMTGDVIMIIKKVDDALYVPPKFINSEKGERYLLLSGNRKVKVETGIEGEDRVEVKGEVREGDEIYD